MVDPRAKCVRGEGKAPGLRSPFAYLGGDHVGASPPASCTKPSLCHSALPHNSRIQAYYEQMVLLGMQIPGINAIGPMQRFWTLGGQPVGSASASASYPAFIKSSTTNYGQLGLYGANKQSPKIGRPLFLGSSLSLGSEPTRIACGSVCQRWTNQYSAP